MANAVRTHLILLRMAGLRRFGAVAAGERIGPPVIQGDSKRIIRQWDREIEDEIRREAAKKAGGSRWSGVAWAALWVLWIALVVVLIVHVRGLR